MDPLTIAAIMGGVSLLKSGQDQRNYKNQMLLEGEKARYSPWTGIGPGSTPQQPNALGTVAQGALTGAMMGQMFQESAAKNLAAERASIDADAKNLAGKTGSATTSLQGPIKTTSPQAMNSSILGIGAQYPNMSNQYGMTNMYQQNMSVDPRLNPWLGL